MLTYILNELTLLITLCPNISTKCEKNGVKNISLARPTVGETVKLQQTQLSEMVNNINCNLPPRKDPVYC